MENTTNFTDDATYKEYMNSMQQFYAQLEKNVNEKVDDSDDTVNQAWETILARYYEAKTYLKDTFNIDEDSILKDKVKQWQHDLKAKGYEIKAKLD